MRSLIVSSDRPYICPIVRDLKNRRVEFRAKVNNIQIDRVSFIEHHSFEAFNGGIRVRQCIKYQKGLTGVDVRRFGGVTIYANDGTLYIVLKTESQHALYARGLDPGIWVPMTIP